MFALFGTFKDIYWVFNDVYLRLFVYWCENEKTIIEESDCATVLKQHTVEGKCQSYFNNNRVKM